MVLFLSSGLVGQSVNKNSTFWKRQRHSVGFGIGFANFLGDLGGRNQIGTDFIYDLEWSETRPALHVNYRYQVGKRVFAKTQFAFGLVGGNDALTEEIFRRNRNLHFRSTLYELSLQVEVDIIQFNNKSRYKRTEGTKAEPSFIYLSLGIGGTKFNPKANFNGQWYPLHNIGTEGQNQENGPNAYSKYTMVIPLGLGYRYQLSNEWTIGAELVHRITFTDYIDDVSTTYYDNTLITQTQGELAGYFADPSLGYYITDGGVKKPLNSTSPGYQRGDPTDNDAYFTFSINAYYKINSGYRSGKGRTLKRRTRRTAF